MTSASPPDSCPACATPDAGTCTVCGCCPDCGTCDSCRIEQECRERNQSEDGTQWDPRCRADY